MPYILRHETHTKANQIRKGKAIMQYTDLTTALQWLEAFSTDTEVGLYEVAENGLETRLTPHQKTTE